METIPYTEFRCRRCRHFERVPAITRPFEDPGPQLTACPKCGEPIRPDEHPEGLEIKTEIPE